jgi:aldose 1-epimerase
MTATSKPRVERAPFGRMPDGALVERIVLRGAEGFEAGIIPYGAVLHTLHVPDRAGKSEDIVLGHDEFDDYLAQRKFLGATIGRYANRIAKAQFVLDGTPVQLDANNGPNMLHGGHDGFDRKLWRIVEIRETPEPAIVLSYTSADGEGGFPGRLEARVIYRVTGPAELAVTF